MLVTFGPSQRSLESSPQTVGAIYLLILGLIITITDINEEAIERLKVKPSPEKLRGSVKKGWCWPPYL